MPIKNLRGPQIQVTSMNYFYLGRVCGNNIKKNTACFGPHGGPIYDFMHRTTLWSGPGRGSSNP